MNKQFILSKGDLKKLNKFKNDNINGFESEEIKNLYNEYFDKEMIEYRIRECKDEEYYYLDLSNMDISDKELNNYLENEEIKKILSKIRLLDLSNNVLKKNPIFVNNYPNIVYNSAIRNKCDVTKHILLPLYRKVLNLSPLKLNTFR